MENHARIFLWYQTFSFTETTLKSTKFSSIYEFGFFFYVTLIDLF